MGKRVAALENVLRARCVGNPGTLIGRSVSAPNSETQMAQIAQISQMEERQRAKKQSRLFFCVHLLRGRDSSALAE
jgi:hypothetical protein